MVEVSENYKMLAQENGRRVFCKILVGNEGFLDDRIIEFDFDDVIHPDWYTIGTTCSNRFAFTVRYNDELNVGDEVKPYISFDNSEWCPLGVFYVARRYVRGNYASITCYDKMYSLDTEYICSLSLPTNTEELIEDACRQGGISWDYRGSTITIRSVPEGETVRDIIGYVAGLNRSCAKINREGVLVLKSSSNSEDFWLSTNNCMDYSRNMSKSQISRLVCNTGKTTLESGSGSEIKTLEFYNPLVNQFRLNNLLAQLEHFSFYGAEVEMQGMPFLESGDKIRLWENDVLYYPIIISEAEYHYENGLSARIYSRNRAYTDAVVHYDDLQETIRDIRVSYDNSYIKFINSEEINLSESSAILADFRFRTPRKGTFAQLDLNFTLDGGKPNILNFRIFVNGVCERTLVHTTSDSNREVVHLYHLADNLPEGENRIYIEAFTTEGRMYIQNSALLATLLMQGTVIDSGNLIAAPNADNSNIVYGCGAEEIQVLPPETSSGKYPYSFIGYRSGTINGATVPVICIAKAYRLADSNDGYTDSIIGFIDGVDLTGWSQIKITYDIFNDSGSSLVGTAYFSTGEKPAVQPKIAYDWTDWTLIGSSTTKADLLNPPLTQKTFVADIEDLSGITRLNFGIHHSNNVWACTVILYISKIELIK